jgi:hypothetical protein
MGGLGIVLCGAAAAGAATIPVQVTAGSITVGCTRAPYDSDYDLLEFYLTGMTGSAAGANTDGTQIRINLLQGRWTAGDTGAFWFSTNKMQTTNNRWETNAYSTINFDSVVSAATIWTNTAGGGGRGPQSAGNLYNFYSGSWYTTNRDANLVYGVNPPGPNPGYTGGGTDSSYLAALYVTRATPDIGIAYHGVIGFTYGDGTVENGAFQTIPEPSMLAVLLAGFSGAATYFLRRRSNQQNSQ